MAQGKPGAPVGNKNAVGGKGGLKIARLGNIDGTRKATIGLGVAKGAAAGALLATVAGVNPSIGAGLGAVAGAASGRSNPAKDSYKAQNSLKNIGKYSELLKSKK